MTVRRAVLIYNPASGRRRQLRQAHVEAAARVFREAGVEVETVATEAAGSGGEQALAAARAGCDTVIACGGDGTMNELLQGVVAARSAGLAQPALGVIPLGTGNALANDLGLSRDPATAARQLLTFAPRRIAAGRAEFSGSSRYFLCIAGIGPDARMIYAINFNLKQRAGMAAYYVAGVRQWLRGRFPMFAAEWQETGGARRQAKVAQVLAVRLGYFGGFLKRLAPRATLQRDDAHLVLFRAAGMATFAAYTIRSFLQREWRIPGVELVPASAVECRPLAGEPARAAQRIYVELDGELAGTLPVRITIEPSAVALLMSPGV